LRTRSARRRSSGRAPTVACCGTGEFGEAVELVERNADRLAPLVSHAFALAEAPAALRFAMEHPADVMKVVIRGERT
jgi:threonine dehydrogenase-like Zn-dependent dehydrogenase